MTQTDLEYELLKLVRGLPDEARAQILQFAKSLHSAHSPTDQAGTTGLSTTLLGSFRCFGMTLTAEELAEARREMWANFPRDLAPPETTQP